MKGIKKGYVSEIKTKLLNNSREIYEVLIDWDEETLEGRLLNKQLLVTFWNKPDNYENLVGKLVELTVEVTSTKSSTGTYFHNIRGSGLKIIPNNNLNTTPQPQRVDLNSQPAPSKESMDAPLFASVGSNNMLLNIDPEDDFPL